MQVMLKVLSGSHEGRELSVSGEKFLIGRSESCQLRPKSESVSRKHCIIVLKDNRVLIQDLKSRNGTYVNDKRLPTDKAKVLAGGDQLRVGKLNFEVVIEHGLQAPKKPEVADMSDAAARTVEAGSHDSRFEEVDVDSWLNEADQIDRVRKLSDPETRQFQIKSGVITEGEGVAEAEDSKDGTWVPVVTAPTCPLASRPTRMTKRSVTRRSLGNFPKDSKSQSRTILVMQQILR